MQAVLPWRQPMPLDYNPSGSLVLVLLELTLLACQLLCAEV